MGDLLALLHDAVEKGREIGHERDQPVYAVKHVDGPP